MSQQSMLGEVTLQEVFLQEIVKSSAVAELRSLEVKFVGDRIILSGVVGSYYYKQLAQELVRSSGEGFEIENAIAVEYDKSVTTKDFE
ncbi:hypothetical protein ETAA8_07660 [Anatilimnocola aggregata]|uniref:BON domain-containing protein n=1 Tax=Anatilimnocola aggregata TaxID=2528021 RepID=A0A517Y652_9BACT|nr:hypothetical protein [Anatilimnocola aggregata]QDU25696.1 hypothetical protein ETAA8_07660 [Anatilimnocola aggregata]